MSNEAEIHTEPTDKYTLLAAISKMEKLEARVNDLSAANNEPEKEWYKNPSVTISLAAFLISIVTTVTSAWHTYKQDIDGKRHQLYTILSQITNNRLQWFDYVMKYKDDQAAVNSIAAEFYGQTTSLAKQAYALVNGLGDANSNDLTSVAFALTSANEVILSED